VDREKGEHLPPQRERTAPQAVAAAILERELDAREISQAAGLSEREVYAALAHVQRTAKSKGLRLRVAPARCAACGFLFAKRERLEKPGKCPLCRSTHVEPARFALERE
jgi:predicted Zn-ribbon and HTH transcriptional regulator